MKKIFLCLALLVPAPAPGLADSSRRPSLEEVRAIFPGAADLDRRAEDLYLVLDASGNEAGFILRGPPADAEPPGFAGPVPFLAGIDPAGRVTGVHLLPSRETRSYARRVAAGLGSAWNGLPGDDVPGARVDALTGATVTSDALIEGVREAFARSYRPPDPAPPAPDAADPETPVFRQAPGSVPPDSPTVETGAQELPAGPAPGAVRPDSPVIEAGREDFPGPPVPGQVHRPASRARRPAFSGLAAGLLTVLVFCLALARFFGILPARQGARFFFNALNFAVPGLLSATLLSLALAGAWAGGGFSPARDALLIGLAIAALGLPFLTGRNFYCYYFCPFGAAQDLAGRSAGRKVRPGPKTVFLLSSVRALLLAGAALIVVAGLPFDLSLLEPFAAFRWLHASPATRLIALSSIALAFFIARPWCRLCPTGGLLDLAARAGRRARKHLSRRNAV